MWTASGRPRLGDFAYRSSRNSAVGAAGAAIIRWQRKRRCVPEDAYIRRGENEPMRRVTGVILFAVLALTFTPPAQGQPAPRRLAFAEVATATLQNNLQLRVAMLDVAVAEAQLAQARGAKNPQVSVSGSYTRSQEQAVQTLTFSNPFGPTPPEITVTLTPPDPNMLGVRLGVEFPLYTGGRLEAQIALAEANLRGARAGFARAAELNAMLNLPLATSLEPTDTLEPRPVSGTLEAAIARATRERPEFAELRARMDAARAAIALAASGARPNVVLGAYYDVGGRPSNLSGTGSVLLAL